MNNKKNDTESIISKKKALAILLLAYLLFVAGFAFLLWAAMMQDSDIPDAIIEPVTMIGFLVCEITAIVVCVKAYPALAKRDEVLRNKRYEEQDLFELCQMNHSAVEQALLEHRFRPTKDGYYHKKKYSVSQDEVYYYVRMVEDVNVENAVSREVQTFNSLKKKGKHICLILMVYMDKVDEQVKSTVKELGKKAVSAEDVVVTAIDSTTSMGYFLDAAKGFSLYVHGCKMIRKVFK